MREMNFRVRKVVGWGVAQAYALVGRRRTAIQHYYSPGTILSIFGHDPRPDVLDGLLAWLKRQGFSFLSTDQLLDMRDGKLDWRPLSAWLTFDDGWAGFEDRLLPILERNKAPATIFIPPGETARGQIWTNSIMRHVPDWRTWYNLSADVRYARVDEVLRVQGDARRLVDQDELVRLAKSGWVTLENHTYTHLSCSHRPVAEVVSEVQKTQRVLRDWTGRLPRLVCYPFGHFTEETDEAIRELGLMPVHSNPGRMSVQSVGSARNMFHETMSTAENIGRVLQAWPRVKVRT